MAWAQRVGFGLVGAATTMLVRRVTRRTMHDEHGNPKLPRTVQRSRSLGLMLVLAGAAGALLALGDVLQEQRAEVAQRA